jgi:eukaryotic-like serine/threonine-protein kinase
MTTMKKGDLLEPYLIERPLSNDGGMSEVYLAFHRQASHLKVALKLQRTDDQNGLAYQDLLRHEAETLAKLRHPGIVRILPLQELNRRVVHIARASHLPQYPWYFAMEYLGDKTLHDELPKLERLPLVGVIHLFYEILLVVHYLHHNHLAHCDIKPRNIFLRHPPAPDRPTAQPVLVDFGGAVSTVHRISRPVGTLKYSPPEMVVAMHRPDTVSLQAIQPDKVDIWALGALLFELIIGEPLVTAQQPTAITSSIVRGMIDAKISGRKERNREDDALVRSLDVLLDKMLSYEPQMRPSTDQLIRALEKILFRSQFV